MPEEFVLGRCYEANDGSLWRFAKRSILSDARGKPIMLCECAMPAIEPRVRAQSGSVVTFDSCGRHLQNPEALWLIGWLDRDEERVAAHKAHRRHVIAGVHAEERTIGNFDPRLHCALCSSKERKPEHEVFFRPSARIPAVSDGDAGQAGAQS